MTHAIRAARTGAAPQERSSAAATRPRWGALFRLAGFGALATAILIPLQIVALIVWPLPEGGVVEWLELFQDSAFIGLVSFDLVILLEFILVAWYAAIGWRLVRPPGVDEEASRA